MRSTEDREIRLGSYEMFHRGEPLTETVWEKLMLGLTTRKYGEAVRNAAYAMEDYAAARPTLDGLHRELIHLNPSAARSLSEGLEETLTVHRLHVPQQLRMTLASTNVIEFRARASRFG